MNEIYDYNLFKVRYFQSKSFLLGLLVTTLCSADIVNVEYIGFNFKLNVIFFGFIGFLYIFNKTRYLKYYFIVSGVFFASLFIAITYSGDYFRGYLYLIYNIVSMFFMVGISFRFSKNNPVLFFNGLLCSLIFQILLSAGLFIFNVQDRASFLYYEPSYFSIALIPLFTFYFFVLLNLGFFKRMSLVLLLIIIVYLLASKSAAAILVFGVSFFVVSYFVLLSRSKNKSRVSLRYIIYFVFLTLFIIFFSDHIVKYDGDDLLFLTLKKFFLYSDFFEFIDERGGNRLNRLYMAWYVFYSNFWFGVGPGYYIEYIYELDHPLLTTPAWVNPMDKPPINIYFEIGTYFGVFSLVTFVALMIYVFKSNINYVIRCGGLIIPLFSAFVVFLIIMALETSYLRLYFWVWVGVLFAFGYKRYYEERN